MKITFLIEQPLFFDWASAFWVRAVVTLARKFSLPARRTRTIRP